MVKNSVCLHTGRTMRDFFRQTLCSEITETKEEREKGKRSLCSMGSHMSYVCRWFGRSLIVRTRLTWTTSSSRRPVGCLCVGPVSSFSWKQQGSSLPWEFLWTANISYLTYTPSKIWLSEKIRPFHRHSWNFIRSAMPA